MDLSISSCGWEWQDSNLLTAQTNTNNLLKRVGFTDRCRYTPKFIMIWKFCCGISMSKIIFTTNSIYLLNYTSKKLGNSLAVVFHHPLPVSVFEILSSQIKFNIFYSDFLFEFTPNGFDISFLKGNQLLFTFIIWFISAKLP